MTHSWLAWTCPIDCQMVTTCTDVTQSFSQLPIPPRTSERKDCVTSPVKARRAYNTMFSTFSSVNSNSEFFINIVPSQPSPSVPWIHYLTSNLFTLKYRLMSGITSYVVHAWAKGKRETRKRPLKSKRIFFCQQMANGICDELIHKQWFSYTDSSLIPHVGGIYVIGVRSSSNRAITYLYLGQSVDVHDRIKRHKYGKQKICDFIRRNLRRNGGKDLRVKWIEEERHRFKERVYIECMEKKLHYKLKYNMKRGNN